MTATVTAKGQIVIPAELRRKYGIKKGTKIHFFEDHGKLAMQPVTDEFVHSLRGKYAGMGIFEEFVAERRRERERER